MQAENALTHSHVSAAKFRMLQVAVFAVGLSAMIVAGWYLVEGMLNFAGDKSSQRVFIAAGIIFQVTESICFVAAAALTSKSFYWRTSLFTLGTILFLFSISVMTLAQKATLQAGESQATALDSQVEALQAQIRSLDNVIGGYRLNAETQSKSIYANSRELGQDSLNRATDLELKKLNLTEKLFELNGARKQTSSDFFKQLEKVTGFPALQTEFYFLVTRSLLLELCGIVLMSFAAHLKLTNTQPNNDERRASNSAFKGIRAARLESNPANSSNTENNADEHWASTYIRKLKQKSNDGNAAQ